MSRTIIVTQTGDGYYTATNGEAVAEKLGFDECLGVVASWLLRPDQQMAYSRRLPDDGLAPKMDVVRGAVYAANLEVTRFSKQLERSREAYYAARSERALGFGAAEVLL